MKVTCRICKKKIERDAAYKIVHYTPSKPEGVNFYYCSETEYQAEEERKKKDAEDKDKVYYLICDMFGYEIQNTKFFDEWTSWNKLKSNEIIYKYLRENEIYLQQICDKPFDNEYQKIRYFSAILKNSLRDFKPKIEVTTKLQPKITEEHYETKYKVKTRQSLEDLEEDCDE